MAKANWFEIVHRSTLHGIADILIYTVSTRLYSGIPHYPFHDKTVQVTRCGRLRLYRKKINLSLSLAGQAVGIKEVDSGI